MMRVIRPESGEECAAFFDLPRVIRPEEADDLKRD
jgi:hypothetical protein